MVLLSGLYSAHMYAVLLATKLFGGTVVGLLTDPPSLTLPEDGRITRALRWLDRRLLIRATREMDALMVLTRQLADTFAPGVPAIVIEGFLSSEDAPKLDVLLKSSADSASTRPEFGVLYAGTLRASYGLQVLLDAFQFLDGENWRLHICGKGPMADSVLAAAARDPRICYEGFLPNERIMERLVAADVLVNPRPSRQDFTAYSFPSKTLEYLASGRPVLSTRLPGIPDEYFEYLQPIDVETATGLAADLRRLRCIGQDARDKLGRRGRDFVLARKTELEQGRKLLAFLDGLRDPPMDNPGETAEAVQLEHRPAA
jgi:glycosyltransferase involved in cell wall biosynthesis